MLRLLVMTAIGLSLSLAAQAQTAPSADAILAKLGSCRQISAGKYALDEGKPRIVPVCRRGIAVYWKADLDVDCDGVRTAQCNKNTDPAYQPDTALHTPSGRPLNAAAMPYIVIPQPSATWDFRTAGIRLGACAAVIWKDRVAYGVFGDTGPKGIIGEASFAMAKALGINPDPSHGGVERAEVTYVVFPGSRVRPVDSPAAARACGEDLARRLVAGRGR